MTSWTHLVSDWLAVSMCMKCGSLVNRDEIYDYYSIYTMTTSPYLYITTLYSCWRTSPSLHKLYNIQLQHFRAKFFYTREYVFERNTLMNTLLMLSMSLFTLCCYFLFVLFIWLFRRLLPKILYGVAYIGSLLLPLFKSGLFALCRTFRALWPLSGLLLLFVLLYYGLSLIHI